MTAPPGDNPEYGEASAAGEGERRFSGVLAAFKAAYAGDPPHAGKELGNGIFSYRLDSPPATVFYARENNKVAILSIKKTGVTLPKGQLDYLGVLAAMPRNRGSK